MKHTGPINHFLIFSITAFFPIYSLSMITGFPGHQLLAALIVLFAGKIYANSSKRILTLILILSFLSIKTLNTGFFELRIIGVSIVGWIVFISAARAAKNLSASKALTIARNILWIEFYIVSTITILQSAEILPIKIGALQFENSVVSAFSDELLGIKRPNGFFYHPYDLALFLTPFLYFLITERLKFGTLFAAIIAYTIYLKSLLLWVGLSAISTAKTKAIRKLLRSNSAIVAATILIAFATTTASAIYLSTEFSAGRTIVWRIYLNDYLNSGFQGFFFGVPKESLSINKILYSDDKILPHNQILAILVFGGFLSLLIFIKLFIEALNELNSERESHIKTLVLLCFVTLGLTGDLSLMFPSWIALCVASIVFNEKIKPKVPPAHSRQACTLDNLTRLARLNSTHKDTE